MARKKEATAEGAAPAALQPIEEGLPEGFFEHLAELQSAAAAKKPAEFADVGALLATEKNEQEGVWCRVPFLEDGEMLLCHVSVSADRRAELETIAREKLQIPIDQPLPAKAREAISRESYFGTVVRGWRGRSFQIGSEPLEFNERNLRQLMTSRILRIFLSGKATGIEAFRAKNEEALRGNS